MQLLSRSLPSLIAMASLLSSSAQAQLKYSNDPQCDKAIQEVKYDIEVNRKGRVSNIRDFEHVQTEYDVGSPFLQKTGITISLGSGRNSDEKATTSQQTANTKILQSPDLLKRYAEKIIGRCGEVVKVSICQAWMDCSVSYSYIGENKIQKDICVSGANTRTRWGERGCF